MIYCFIFNNKLACNHTYIFTQGHFHNYVFIKYFPQLHIQKANTNSYIFTEQGFKVTFKGIVLTPSGKTFLLQ